MRNQEVMIERLTELVSIPSVSGEGEGEYPFGKAPYDALVYVLNLCEAYGFTTKQCGNHCGYAQIGEGEELFGILVHLDVVPPGDGWDTNPYQVTKKEGKLFGRGVVDDKGPVMAVIHAMKELVEDQISLKKRVRIIFGTSEETGGEEDLKVYTENEELPAMGFTPDADFPVVYLEKAICEIQLCMPLESSGLIHAVGGNAPNMVADKCKLSYACNGKEIVIEANGKSAHGSMPWLGENAIGKCMELIEESARKQGVRVPIAEFYNQCIAMSTDGNGLDCNFVDEESGATTVNPGMIEVKEDNVLITLDIRCAIGCTKEQVLASIENKVKSYGLQTKMTFWSDFVYMNKESELIKNLMSVYRDITGTQQEPLIMGGGTYARSMKNIVAFGPVFPGRECMEHQPNEYIYIEDLMMAKEIYYEAIRRLCQ